MLVGGGELHDRWESLVGGARAAVARDPALHRDHARRWSTRRRPRRVVLPELAELLRGRVLVAHNARVRPARARARPSSAPGVAWPDAAGAVHGRAGAPPRPARAPAQARARWPTSLGIEVEVDPPRAGRRRDVRARVLRAVPAAVRARADGRRGARAAAPGAAAPPARAGDRRRAGSRARRASPMPDLLGPARGARRLRLPQRRRARPLYVGKSVRAAHARAGALRRLVDRERLDRAGRDVDHQHDGLRARRAAAREPADPRAAPAGQRRASSASDRYVYLRCRLDIAFPVLEVAPEPARGPRRVTSGRCAAARRPSSWSSSSTRCSACATAGAGCRAAQHPSRLRADGPLPVAVPGRPRPEPLPPAPRRGARRCSAARGDGGAALLAHVDAQMRAAAGGRALRARGVAAPPARAPELAARPPRRRAGRDARAAAARARRRTRAGDAPRRVLARRRPRRRLGAARPTSTTSRERTRGGAARAATARGTARCLSPDEVAEARIVSTWLDRNPSPALDLTGGRGAWAARRASCADGAARASPQSPSTGDQASRRALERQLDDDGGGAAGRRSSSPGSASRRTSASAIGPRRGETTTVPTRRPRARRARSGVPGATGSLRRRPRRWRLGLPR